MKVNDFTNILKRLANDTPTRYQGGGVGQHDGNTFLFDCGGLIKSIIWGFNFDYSQYRGGAVYQSNGLPDVGCDRLFNEYCYDKSTDFTKIEVGELVWMSGHIGVYVGDRKVIEATSAWNNKVLVSEVGNNGERTKNGSRCLTWTHHGKFNKIEYPVVPEPTSEYYKVIGGDLWLLDDNGGRIRTYPTDTLVKFLNDGYDKYGYHYYHVEVVEDGAVGYMASSYLEPTNPPQIDYEKLYKEQLEINENLKNDNEKLKKDVENLQNKISKAIEDLK